MIVPHENIKINDFLHYDLQDQREDYSQNENWNNKYQRQHNTKRRKKNKIIYLYQKNIKNNTFKQTKNPKKLKWHLAYNSLV